MRARPRVAPSRPASRRPSPDRERDLRGMSKKASNGPTPKGKEAAIQVVVRCRGPLSEQEQSLPVAIKLASASSQELRILSDKSSISAPTATVLPESITHKDDNDKVYQFDKCYGEVADQILIFKDIVAPLLQECLEGFNCTLFCYGQTASGKTHTMTGDLQPSKVGTFGTQAGIIPRTLYKLFQMLEQQQQAEYSVRVSMIELYNEELRDLATLSSEPANATLKIFDDNARKGVIVQGAEECLIRNAQEGINVLTRGEQRRHIAATNCNDRSSRSHSIFTITVHLKEQASLAGSGTVPGAPAKASEDMLKVGKMNLVDLAGSENVGRSGAKEGRAREAGMINQSLLTLGRVINALVEKSSHVPYRESKLTRLLQDSLGGRTKTVIIATITPFLANIEETLSTLEYASRARCIQNRPEQNSKMTRTALINQYAFEIERLKADLVATREKNGIYLSTESWSDLSSEHEARRLLLEDTKRSADLLDMQLRTMSEQFEHSLTLLGVKDGEISKLSQGKTEMQAELDLLSGQLAREKKRFEAEAQRRQHAEQGLQSWKSTADMAISDTRGLFEKIARKNMVESANAATIASAQRALGSTASIVHAGFDEFDRQCASNLDGLKHVLDDFCEVEHDILTKAETEAATHLDAILERLQAMREGSKRAIPTDDPQSGSIAGALEDVKTKLHEGILQATSTYGALYSSVNEEMQAMTAKLSSTFVQAIASCQASASLLREEEEAATQARDLYKEEELTRLRLENERLKSHNEKLEAIVANQETMIANFQHDFVASMQQQLGAFFTKQTDTLKASCKTLQDDLTEADQERQVTSKTKDAEFKVYCSQVSRRATMQQTCQSLEHQLESGASSLSKHAESITRALERESQAHMLARDLDSTVAADMEQLQQLHRQGIQQTEQDVHTMSVQVADLEAACRESDHVHQRARFSLSKASIDAVHAIQQGLTDHAETIDRHLEDGRDQLDLLSKQTSTFLSHKRELGGLLKEDVSTGKTPQKRSYPTFDMPLAVELSPTLSPLALPAALPEDTSVVVPASASLAVSVPASGAPTAVQMHMPAEARRPKPKSHASTRVRSASFKVLSDKANNVLSVVARSENQKAKR